jgi:tRNA(Phe) wybutosine-synthesizing methylase Tyw3
MYVIINYVVYCSMNISVMSSIDTGCFVRLHLLYKILKMFTRCSCKGPIYKFVNLVNPNKSSSALVLTLKYFLDRRYCLLGVPN